MMWTILRNLGHLIVVKASQSTVVEAQTVIFVWYEVFIKSRILWAFHMLKENLNLVRTLILFNFHIKYLEPAEEGAAYQHRSNGFLRHRACGLPAVRHLCQFAGTLTKHIKEKAKKGGKS